MTVEINTAIIYLIDDEQAIRDSMALFLQSVGLKVKCFDSAQAFLDNYDQEQPGCLILDVRMPDIGGLELQAELIDRSIQIPIIFISGNAKIADTVRAFKAGALDFLEKPFDNNVLLEKINEAVAIDIDVRNEKIRKDRMQVCFDKLTQREKQVLKLIIHHKTSKDVAKQLCLSHRTVEAHRAHIMEKLQAENIIELINIALNYPFMDECKP